MNLSDIASLTIKDKCLWLKSPEGIEYIKEWLSSGYSLHKLAPILGINCTTLYKWCDQIPELAAITGRTLKINKIDYTRPLAYRLITDFNYNTNRGRVLSEYETADELWQDPYIQRHFDSFDVCKDVYYNNYIEELHRRGIYKLGNFTRLSHCTITRHGVVKPKILILDSQ